MKRLGIWLAFTILCIALIFLRAFWLVRTSDDVAWRAMNEAPDGNVLLMILFALPIFATVWLTHPILKRNVLVYVVVTLGLAALTFLAMLYAVTVAYFANGGIL